MLPHRPLLNPIIMAVALVISASAAAQEGDFPVEKPLNMELAIAAKGLGVSPQDLRMLDRHIFTMPNTKVTAKALKVFNLKSGDSQRIVLDESNRPVDHAQLLAAEAKAHRKKYGNMSVGLHRLLKHRPNDKIPVLIYLNIPDERIDKSELPEGKELAVASRRAAEIAEKREMVARETFAGISKEMRLQTKDFEISGPFVAVTLPVRDIRMLSRMKDVSFVGLDAEEDVLDHPTIDESLPTTRTNNVHNMGIQGSGVKIAILESGKTTKNQSCFNIADIQSTSGSTNSHMTKSVAIIGNRYKESTDTCDGKWTGYAPEASILLGNKGSGNSSQYRQRYEWAKSKGANVISMSWHAGSEETDGSLHARDLYFDYWVTRYPWPSVFTSAGNQSASDAYASGKGYNFFGVGNIANDGNGDRCDDVMTASSSWKDPDSPHNDREIPEVASPGSRHDLLDTDFGGTSAATPVTAAIVSLFMDKRPALKIWPEAIRAILFATSNYQNADNQNWATWNDGKDGTGLTNALYGHYTAGRRESTSAPQYRAHDYGTMQDDDFSGGYFNKTWKAYTHTTSAKIRVALTWNSNTFRFPFPFSPIYLSFLDADLDLHIFDPDGQLVSYSLSWDSNHEFVEFTPTKVGAYTIKVRGYTVPDNFTRYYSVAWTTHYDLCQ